MSSTLPHMRNTQVGAAKLVFIYLTSINILSLSLRHETTTTLSPIVPNSGMNGGGMHHAPPPPPPPPGMMPPGVVPPGMAPVS